MLLKTIGYFEMVGAAVKQHQAWGVYVSNGLTFEDREGDAAIFNFIIEHASSLFDDLKPYEIHNCLIQNTPLFLFEDEREARAFYNIFEQPLIDSSPVFACLFDDKGICLTENT